MKKLMFVSAVTIGALLSTAPAQAQTQQCPPGQSGTFPYCQVVPPPPPPPAGCSAFTSKLSLLRGTFDSSDRTISILAPITRRASDNARIELHAANRRTNFIVPINSALGRIRVIRPITAAQAKLGTGILTINYPGDADTRAQVVRLRAANNPAGLRLTRPQITSDGRLVAQGNVVSNARGVVRIQVEYVNRADGQTVTLKFRATINSDGRWRLNTQLPPGILLQIARRCGTVHSYTLFTGYFPRRIRGEMRSLQVLPAP